MVMYSEAPGLLCDWSKVYTDSALPTVTAVGRAFFLDQKSFPEGMFMAVRKVRGRSRKASRSGRWLSEVGDNAWDRSGTRQRRRHEAAGAPTWRLSR